MMAADRNAGRRARRRRAPAAGACAPDGGLQGTAGGWQEARPDGFHQEQVPLPCQLDQFPGFAGVDREGLLAQDVFPGFKRGTEAAGIDGKRELVEHGRLPAVPERHLAELDAVHAMTIEA